MATETHGGERLRVRFKNEFMLLREGGQKFYDELIGEINGAQKSIQFQSFFFGKDLPWGPRVGGPVLKALEQAAKRGVVVQAVADGMVPPPFSTYVTLGAIHEIRKLEKKDVPIAFRYPIERGVRRSLRNKLVQRDHTKLFVIDAELPGKSVAYIGGRNIWRKDIRNNDFMVRIKGPIVAEVKEKFDECWNGGRVEVIDVDEDQSQMDTIGEGQSRIIRDSRDTDRIPDTTVAAIKQAKKRIWIETPYLDRLHLSQLLIERKKENPELDIRFVTSRPWKNNQFPYILTSKYYMNELAENGITVYAFNGPQFDHAKAVLIDDDLAVAGSSNFSRRKFFAGRNAEVELFSRDKKFIAQIEEWFEKEFLESKPHISLGPNITDKIYRRFRKKSILL